LTLLKAGVAKPLGYPNAGEALTSPFHPCQSGGFRFYGPIPRITPPGS